MGCGQGPPSRRVAVTGIGVLTPLGDSLRATAERLRGPAPGPPAPRLEGFRPRSWFPQPKALKLTDRKTRLAVAAAAQALEQAALPPEDREELGVRIGCATSDLQPHALAAAIGPDSEGRVADDVREFARRVLDGLHPFWLLVQAPNMIAAHVSIQHRLRGANSALTSGWIAGLQAIGETFHEVRDGGLEAGLAGGADCGDDPFDRAALALEGLAPPAFLPAEAAALLVLEERARARRRGHEPGAEVRGYATMGPGGNGALKEAIRQALDDARWRSGEVVELACAAPPGSPWEEEVEAARSLFPAPGPRTRNASRRLGHSLGASGAVEAALLLYTDGRTGGRSVAAVLGLEREAAAVCLEVGG